MSDTITKSATATAEIKPRPQGSVKFAKIVFWVAAIWGVLVITPLFFMFNAIGVKDPPAITHPGFYYGFVTAAFAWQLVFFVIARDPVRFRPIIVPAIVEKFGYGIAVIALFLQARMHASDLVFGCADLVLGVLFIVAFARSGDSKMS